MTLAYADAHAALLDDLDERVRESVRRDGVDPQAEVAAVRRIAERVVTSHDERSLTGQVAPVPDPQAMVGELVARVSGFGPLQPYLDDPTVEEVWINDPSQVFVARQGRHELTTTVLTAAQVQELVERMLKSSGRRIDISQPFVDAMLPEGHRLHVVLEGISRRLHRRQHPQVHPSCEPVARPRRSRHPHASRRAVPGGRRPGRAQHPRRRWHPGRQHILWIETPFGFGDAVHARSSTRLQPEWA